MTAHVVRRAEAPIFAAHDQNAFPSNIGVQVVARHLELGAGDVAVRQSIANIGKAEERKAGEIVEDDGSGAARIADFLKEAKVI